MKLPPSALLIKLFSDLPLASGRSSSGGKVLLGSLVVLSVFITISYFPGMDLPSMNLAAAAPTPATSNLPLFGNPTSEDFMSYAVSIMPTVPGANLNTSNVAGSTNCDLLVPVTYIDAGCMNSLPLLFPFNEPQHTNIAEPTNQTFYNDYNNSSALDLSIGVASDNITAGDTQTVTVSVSDQNSTQPIPGALVLTNVTDSFNSLLHQYSGTADEVGQVSFPFVIPADAASDIYTVSVLASADGYENTSASTTFDVIGSGDFFDNSTFDNSFDSSSSSDGSSDNCCDSSSDDFNSPTVKSVSPGHNEDNVPLDTKIKVTFDEKMDQNTLDDGSLFLENVDGFGNVPNFNADPSSKSVTYTLDEPLEPGTTYRAQIEFSVEDDNGNSIDCIDSNDVDSNCQWEFTTTGSNNPTISLSPTSGPGGTQVTITGTGFVPDSSVIITFEGLLGTITTVTANSNGGFSTTITVPLLSLPGPHTIAANSASKTFTVTSSTTPIIILDPTSGTAGSSVTVAGINFDPNSDVTIKFGTDGVTTNPSPLKTTSTGTFSGIFSVPISSSVGDNTVTATQGSNLASRTFKVTASTVPVITLNATSGPIGTAISITGTGFAPTTAVTIKFGDTTVANPTSNSNGGFSTSFTVPSSLSGPKTVTATQGSNIATKPFTVTPSTVPAISLSPASGRADSSVSVIGSGLDPNTAATINFDGSPVDTIPPTVIANSNGEFSATFRVPESASLGDHPVVVSQADNSASTTFKVTLASSSSFAAITRSNVSSFKALDNQSPPLSNNSSAIIHIVTNNSSSETADSNGKVTFENNTRPANTYSAQRTDDTSTSPTTKKINNTSLTGSTDNKINEIHVSSASSQANDTSNNKKKTDKGISISHAKSKDQLTSTRLTKDNSNDENQSSVKEDKTITKVKSPISDNQPEKQSRSSDSIKKDRALFFKYLNSNKDNVKEEQKIEVNNRPLAVDDDATTESNIPVKINILGNDKDPDGDKLSVMGVSRPVRGTIESDNDGTITYSPLKSWSGTERFGYTISDGRGGVATGTVTVIVQNQPPEAEDQDVSVNANSPIKIKLEAKDPDDDKLKFVLVTKPSHGRIAQFSSSTGTLGYVPDENYDGKDDFTFKVHDGTVFSKDAKVSIKIEKNEKLSNDPVQGSDQQQKKEPSRQSPTNEKKSTDDKSNNNDTPPSDSSQQPSTSSQDTEQPIKDQKEEQQQSIEPDKSTSDGNTVPRGESQPNS